MCESDSDRMSSVMTGHQFSEIHVWHLGRKWEPGMEPRTEKEGIKHSANSGNKVLKMCWRKDMGTASHHRTWATRLKKTTRDISQGGHRLEQRFWEELGGK